MTQKMPKVILERKRMFKASLALVGMTVKDWARSNGITVTHLNEVLNKNRVSAPLDEKIDAFIAKPRAPKATAA